MADAYLQLLGSEWDFPPTRSGLGYTLCGTPRSGSTLLCLWLWGTGHAGAPWEYFNPRQAPALVRRLGVKTPDQYLPALKFHRTSPNGIFGLKLFFDQWLFLKQNFPTAVEGVVQDRIIFLRREDAVAQAVSMARAWREGRWAVAEDATPSEGTNPTDPDPELIEFFRQSILAQNQGWEDWFAANGVQPLRLVHEEIRNDRDACLKEIGSFLGLGALKADVIALPRTLRQADVHSERWREAWSRRYG